MSLRFRICLIVWLAVVVLTALTGKVQAQDTVIEVTPVPAVSDADWAIEISPALKLSSVKPVEVQQQMIVADETGQPLCGNAMANADRYTKIYESIPFNRAEYAVNPSYRHDSTMEILTGNARHQTILRHNTGMRPATAPASGAQQTVIPYGFVRPSLRLNYYRHFPSLNPYYNMFWNYSGIY